MALGGSPASSLSARLHQTIAAWQSLSPAEQAERLAGLSGAAADPVEAVLSWLAHSAVCWQQEDVAGCDAALAKAQTLAGASGDAELLALVDLLREQLAAARHSGGAGLGQELGAAPIATEAGESALIRAVQEALTVAIRAGKGP